jgi:hypothetical protein
VYDQYRDELEEWQLKNAEAQAALRKVEKSVDSDGGGSKSNWAAPSVGEAFGMMSYMQVCPWVFGSL